MSLKKAAIILAAGKGKRMKSDLPKVLHEINGRPMVQILLDTLLPMKFERIVVVIGHKGELVQKALSDYPVEFVWQHKQLGTGHAVMMARENLRDFDGITLVAAGDVPFLSAASIDRLFDVHQTTGAAATCLSAEFVDPTGYGRIVRDGNSDFLERIVEHKDASEKELELTEINTGTFCFDTRQLFAVVDEIDNQNVQREYYLTDAVKIMHDKGLKVAVVRAANPDEVRGVNSKEELKNLEQKVAGQTP